MPPQTPSDRSYPEQARWNEPSQLPRRNESQDQRRWNEAPEQQRWSEPSQQRWDRAPEQPRWGPDVDEAQTRFYDDRGGRSADYAAPPTAPQPPASRKPPMSRRSMLRGAAGVGVVGAVAAAGAGAVVAINKQDDKPPLMPVSKPVAMASMAPSAMAGPLVVYIADTTNGLLDVFGGTGQTRIHNPALVKQILDNLKLA